MQNIVLILTPWRYASIENDDVQVIGKLFKKAESEWHDAQSAVNSLLCVWADEKNLRDLTIYQRESSY